MKTVENFHIDNCTIEIDKFFLVVVVVVVVLLLLLVLVLLLLLILSFYFRQPEVVGNRPYSMY